MGNTVPHFATDASGEDHPHLRGEYGANVTEDAKALGSPPLAWGILRRLRHRRSLHGITPTCVGNTIKTKVRACYIRDHPHLRGEYFMLMLSIDFFRGSPPLAWGIQYFRRNSFIPMGITPTCVGNTPET